MLVISTLNPLFNFNPRPLREGTTCGDTKRYKRNNNFNPRPLREGTTYAQKE